MEEDKLFDISIDYSFLKKACENIVDMRTDLMKIIITPEDLYFYAKDSIDSSISIELQQSSSNFYIN